MSLRHAARRLRRDRRGVTAVEFALVIGPFLALIMGSLDLGYQVYLQGLATGAMERAARRATIGNRTRDQVVQLIRSEVGTILPRAVRNDPNAIKVNPLSYYNFSAVGGGERITGDTAPVGVYNTGDCYEDRNGNGRYDATGGGGADLGTGDDIVYYDVTVTAPRLFPVSRWLGWSPNAVVNTRTLIRNQPYGAQQVKILCS